MEQTILRCLSSHEMRDREYVENRSLIGNRGKRCTYKAIWEHLNVKSATVYVPIVLMCLHSRVNILSK